MDSKTEERIKALEIALNNEVKERDFYLKHSKRTTNNMGKMMFATIAGDEDEHYRRIQELHQRLIKEGKWPETVPIQVKGTEVKAVIQKVIDSVDASAKADINDMEAIKIAIDFETKGEKFYRDLAQRVDNPMERKFYEFLASMEGEHRVSLQDTWDYFQDPAGWLRVKERLHVDGA
ncbi:MAG TPA: ferritin family protein [Thermodesulfobacteriota bacterium]|nr:ferritin family protein [Thermodesulfobacteriota bacterium]